MDILKGSNYTNKKQKNPIKSLQTFLLLNDLQPGNRQNIGCTKDAEQNTLTNIR